MSEPFDLHPSDEQLEALRRGELTDSVVAVVKCHVDQCDECQERLEFQDEASGLFDLEQVKQRLKDREWTPPTLEGYTYVEFQDKGEGMEPQPKAYRDGGGGVLFLARNRANQRVVIKFLRASPGMQAPERLRLVEEVQAASTLSHPAFVRMLDFGWDGNCLWYAMEEFGLDLYQYQCAEGKLEPLTPSGATEEVWGRWRYVVGCFRQVVEGMVHAHDKGMIHRDLKPGNILVGAIDPATRLPTLKICDFGAGARIHRTSRLTEVGYSLGTPDYMAPEQAAGAPPSFAMDVYGLGVVLHFMLTGQAPRNSPPELTGVPFDLETIRQKCLETEPGKRYSRVKDLLIDLDRFNAGMTPLAKRRSWLQRTRAWVRRNPSQTAAFVLLGGIALALGVALERNQFARKRDQDALSAEQGRRDAERIALVETRRSLEAVRGQLAAERLKRLEDARALLGRGRLREAEGVYDELVAATPAADALPLRVERLRTLFSYGRWTKLDEELRALANATELTNRQRAELLLHRGDFLLWDKGRESQNAGLALLRQALSLGALDPSDASFARGLLARSTKEAVRHFEDAVRSPTGRFHLRANLALLMEWTLSGRFDDARRHVTFLQAAFPEEVATPLALTLIATLEQDRPARQRHRDELAGMVQDKVRLQGIDAILNLVDANIAAANGPQPKNANPLVALVQQLLPVLQAKPLDLTALPSTVGIGLPVLARPTQTILGMNEAFALIRAGKEAEALKVLAKLEEESPESMILQMQAIARMQVGLKAGSKAGLMREATAIYELIQRAADAPTLIPYMPNRQNFRWLCVLLQTTSHNEQVVECGGGAALAVGGNPLLATGPLGALAVLGVMQANVQAIPQIRETGHLRRALVETRPGDQSRDSVVDVFADLFPPDVLRVVLIDWTRQEPANVKPMLLRTRLEYEEQNYRECVRHADAGLALLDRQGVFFSLEKAQLAGYRHKALAELPKKGAAPGKGGREP